MGRKAVNKQRKQNLDKARPWVEKLIPGLTGQSLAKLTMADFARIMGKSKSTVYEYFTSKEEILEYAVRLHIEKIEGFEAIFQGPQGKPREEYEAVLALLAGGLDGITSAFLHELRTLFPTAWQPVEEVFELVIAYFRQFHQHYMDQGVFKPTSLDLLTRMDSWFAFEFLLSHREDEALADLLLAYIRMRFEGIML